MTETTTHSESGQQVQFELCNAAFGNKTEQSSEKTVSFDTDLKTKSMQAQSALPDLRSKEGLLQCVDDALETLEAELVSGQSEGLKEYLKFFSKFHSYSFGNILLIYTQKPDAEMVAGYRRWQNMGRQVRKGEKGLRILAPVTRKKTDDDDRQESDKEQKTKRIVTGFRAASVFDISQTDGEELPKLHKYSGDPEDNLNRLKAFVAERKIELLMECVEGGALGVSEEGRIRVRPDLDPPTTFAVLAHEVAHELLHKGQRRAKTTRAIRETEAEAVSYAVCSAVGLESFQTSSDYIQLHQGDAEKLRASLDSIRTTASEILGALELKR